MNGLKQRAKTVIELAENSLFYITPQPLDEDAQKALTSEELEILKLVEERLAVLPEKSWIESELESHIRGIAEELNVKLGKMAQPIRFALTGKAVSPSVFEIMHVLGKESSL